MADELTYGTDPSRFVGAGLDFAQTRVMQIGDSVRAIDWRVTARTGRLHVKDYEAEKRMNVFVLVDTSASMSVASNPAVSKHDVAVWIAAVIATLALNRRSPVALVSGGERVSTCKPTTSQGQITRWIEALRAGGLDEHTDLCGSLRRIDTIARHRAIIVVISDVHQPGAVEVLHRLAQKHDVMVFQPMDRAERGGLRAGFVRAAEAETGESFLSLGSARWFGDAGSAEDPLGLVGAGADHAVVMADEPIVPAVRRVLNAKRGRGRSAR